MKTSQFTRKIPAVITLVLSFILAQAAAQKLPNVQQSNLRAPIDTKIDGIATEWNNTFQAYNHATSIFYTIANDDKNLYVIIQATVPHTVEKILSGGVTLTLSPVSKEKVTPITLTYPLLSGNDRSGIVSKLRDESTNMTAELPDMNIQLTNNSKEIKIGGIKEIPDSLISVYNEYGIKTNALIDNHKAYTYELALPLKYLQQLIGSANKLNYKIRLNGVNLKIMKISIDGVGADPSSPAVMNLMTNLNVGNSNIGVQDLTNPTDFSGSYTLAK